MVLRVTGKATFRRCLIFFVMHIVTHPLFIMQFCDDFVCSAYLLQVIRIIPYSAVQLFSYEVYKVVVTPWFGIHIQSCIDEFQIFLQYYQFASSENFPEQGWGTYRVWATCCWCLCGHDVYTCNLFICLLPKSTCAFQILIEMEIWIISMCFQFINRHILNFLPGFI